MRGVHRGQSRMNFARVRNARESWSANRTLPRHRHVDPYAALVVAGGYKECGSRGRFRVGPGDVLMHDAFDTHLDRFQSEGAQVLNLVIDGQPPGFSFGRVNDPDSIVRAAERDIGEAELQLRFQLCERGPAANEWTDHLAFDLVNHPDRRLEDWAAEHGLASATLSCGFKKVFGVTPAASAPRRGRAAPWR